MANKNLSGKVAIVTGASDGMGREIAKLLGKEHMTVVLVARRKQRLEKVASEIIKSGSQALVITTDLRRGEDIKNVVHQTIEKYGQIDILINVAGMGYYDWIEETTFEEITEQYQVNVIAMAQLISEVVPVMKKQKSGHIINFSSYASRAAIPPLTIYASTKYAIEGLSDGLRRELAPWGIKVTRIHPSAVNTKFNSKAAGNDGLNFPYDKLTGVTKEKVAGEIIKVIKHPKMAVFISRNKFIIDFTTSLNHYFPAIVDLLMRIQVPKMWREQGKHDLQAKAGKVSEVKLD